MPRLDRADCGLLAAIDPALLQPGFGLQCLTPPEVRRVGAIRHPGRRRRWLAGRLCAKFLVLNARRTGMDVSDTALQFYALTREMIEAFSPGEYRDVEMQPAAAGGIVALNVCGVPQRLRVGITHVDGLSCAHLGTATVGLDMERVRTFVPSFYSQNFNPAERHWVAQTARGETHRGWLWTFLWTLKEAWIKTGRASATGVWGLPRIELSLIDRVDWGVVLRSARLGSHFQPLRLSVLEPPRAHQTKVRVTATPDLILSLVVVP